MCAEEVETLGAGGTRREVVSTDSIRSTLKVLQHRALLDIQAAIR